VIRAFAGAAACVVLGASSAVPAQSAPEGKRVHLITLDPGHFHAALVQKFMYEGVDPVVRVYAPGSDDLSEHLKRIEGFNTRADQPTQWREQVYTGADYVDKMLADRDGNVVVISGNNARKTEYITRAVEAGLNVLADKPMAITPADFERLKGAFATARKNGVLLADIMTERFEIATILQRELSRRPALFGELERGTPQDPAITKVSVHHFSKEVAGAPLKRPQWFFDVRQQGEGIVDVSNHLVDLVQWEAFPEQTLKESDVEMLSARRWPTAITRSQFQRVTGANDFPSYLRQDVRDGALQVYSNGEFTYRLRGVHAKVSVTWAYEAPPGGNDTHYSVMRGTKANLVIQQGAEQKYRPTLYVERAPEAEVRAAVASLQGPYPGVGAQKEGNAWLVTIPDKYHVGHEAHFAQVTQNFLGALRDGKLPEWEVPNMLTKQFTIMQAFEKSRTGGSGSSSLWQRDEHSLTRLEGGKPLWKLSLDPAAGKPFFHPVTVAGGAPLTARSPEDHPWHYGVWFSWKYVNGVNYWEEDRTTGKPAGATRWRVASMDPRPDGTATIVLDVSYVHPSGRVDLTETRTLEVSAPGPDGSYAIDWRAHFKAGAEGALLDRTPMPGEPKGQVNGGYAGMSVRFAPEPLAIDYLSTEGPITEFKSDRARPAVPAIAANLSAGGKAVGGIALYSDPANAGANATWYMVNNKEMRFSCASILAPKPMQLAPGRELKLHYRIAIRRDPWTPDTLLRMVRSEGDRS
jgi:predicted dehydrogenase